MKGKSEVAIDVDCEEADEEMEFHEKADIVDHKVYTRGILGEIPMRLFKCVLAKKSGGQLFPPQQHLKQPPLAAPTPTQSHAFLDRAHQATGAVPKSVPNAAPRDTVQPARVLKPSWKGHNEVATQAAAVHKDALVQQLLAKIEKAGLEQKGKAALKEALKCVGCSLRCPYLKQTR